MAAFKLERVKAKHKYRVLFCAMPDCAQEGDDYNPWKIVVDDDGSISIECGHCGEGAALADVVKVCNGET